MPETASTRIPLVDVPSLRPEWSIRRLRRGVHERRFPFSKVGGRILIDLDDLDCYVAACRIEAAS